MRFDAPSFEPHLTVFVAAEKVGSDAGERPSPQTVAQEIGHVCVELTATGVFHSGQFTKTLFVRFEKCDSLGRLAEQVQALTGASEHYVLDPHLSLLYKRLPEQSRRKLAENLRLPFRTVTFGDVCAVRCALPTKNTGDVNAWQVLTS